jgi:hypothetical protein
MIKKPHFAILLSGQPRYRKGALESILKNIIQYNNCDIFGHFWEYDETNKLPWRAIAPIANQRDQDTYTKASEYIEKIKEIIPFTKLKVQKQINFSTDRFHPGTEKERVIAEVGEIEADHHFRRCNFIVQSQWYSICEANKLRQEYEKETGIKYDGILRFRPDMMIDRPIDLKTYDPTKLNIPYKTGPCDDNDVQYTDINDMIAYGNGKSIDIYADFYNHQDEIFSNSKFDALLSGYALALYFKIYLGYDQMISNYFNFTHHPVHNLMILP